MANRNSGRIDRLTQMTKQEELIARKRQEILDRQRTTQLAKAVAAAQSLAAKLKAKEEGEEPDDEISNVADIEEKVVDSGIEEAKNVSAEENILDTSAAATKKGQLIVKTGKISFGLKRTQTPCAIVAEEPPSKLVNTFCNDGSFLENFKKILEKSEQPQPFLLPETFAKLTGQVNEEESVMLIAGLSEQKDVNAELYAFNAAQSQMPHLVTSQEQQILIPHLNMTLTQPPPPPPPVTSMESGVHGAYFTTTITTAVPPPPPPPQLPLAMAHFLPPPPLFMIPPPEPLQINAIPAPKEFNLSAIPNPQLNLDVIKVPEVKEQQQKQQQQHQAQGILKLEKVRLEVLVC